MVLIPPIPEPMITPVRSANDSSRIGLGIPASASASTDAAQARCTYRSCRRISFLGITSSGWKSRTSPAILASSRDGSNEAMQSIPLRPAMSDAQVVGTSLPSGVMAPMPVTTTRRSPRSIELGRGLCAITAARTRRSAGRAG
jgi:hypothetical protein